MALNSSSFVASCLRVKQSTLQRGFGLGLISHEDAKTRREGGLDFCFRASYGEPAE